MIPAEISFKNIEQLRKVVDPVVLQKASASTVRQLSDRAATVVSKKVRERYSVKAGLVRQALTKGFVSQGTVPERILHYAASRLSLRHFGTRARPIIKTASGPRKGAKVKLNKGRPARLVKGGFYGKARGSGSEQIFARVNPEDSYSKLKKLTGPSVSQMVRGSEVTNAVADFVRKNADELLSKNLDHFYKKKIGVR